MGEAAKAPRLAKLKEACRYGRFSRSTAYRLIASEKIAAFKRGYEVMVDLNTIDAYHAGLPKLEVRPSKWLPGKA